MKALVDQLKENKQYFAQNALLLPYSKETKHLLENPDLTVCKIKKLSPMNLYSEEHAVELINDIFNEDNQINNYDCNFTILGYLHKLGSLRNDNLLIKALKLAIDKKMHVFSFENIQEDKYYDFIQQSQKEGLNFYCPLIRNYDYDHFERMNLPNIHSKHLMILGTGSNQGKFTLLLNLIRKLRRSKIPHYSIGTEHHSELFGMDYVFPYGVSRNVKLRLQKWPKFLNMMKNYFLNQEKRVMLSSIQSSTINYALQKKLSYFQSTASIAFFLGLEPTDIILVFNPELDTNKYIWNTINFIKSIYKLNIIGLAFSNRQNKINNSLTYDIESIDQTKRVYTELFSIPTYCIALESDIDIMLSSFLNE